MVSAAVPGFRLIHNSKTGKKNCCLFCTLSLKWMEKQPDGPDTVFHRGLLLFFSFSCIFFCLFVY